MTRAEIEAKARRVGARRKRHGDEGDAIQGAVAEVVAEAQGEVPMERLADLLGMHRSSIYELYIGGSNDDNAATAPSGAAQGKPPPDSARTGKARAQAA